MCVCVCVLEGECRDGGAMACTTSCPFDPCAPPLLDRSFSESTVVWLLFDVTSTTMLHPLKRRRTTPLHFRFTGVVCHLDGRANPAPHSTSSVTHWITPQLYSSACQSISPLIIAFTCVEWNGEIERASLISRETDARKKEGRERERERGGFFPRSVFFLPLQLQLLALA